MTANTSNNSKTNSEMTNKISYERKSVLVSSLTIHPGIELLDSTMQNDVFKIFYDEFQYLETPVITEDNYVITHAIDVLAAKEAAIENIDVVVLKNVSEEQVIRFISFKEVIRHGKNRVALSQSIKLLTNHLTKTESGKEWAKSIPGAKTRKKVANILGVSDGTVQNVSAIAKHNPELLEKIDAGETTNTEALDKRPKVVPFVSKKRYENVLLSNTGTRDQPKITINGFKLDTKELGELNFSVDGSKVTGLRNGVQLESMTHNITSDYDSEGRCKSQHIQEHVFQTISDRFSIHIIIRDLDQLGNTGELAIAA